MEDQLSIFTAVIIGATVYTSYLGFTRRRFMEDFIFSPVRVLRDRQYHRLISSGFLHANWQHLLFNMFSLYAFGSNIEAEFGPHIFLIIYFVSIPGGSLLSLLLHRHDEAYQALGASGGVCGVIFASIFLLPGGGVMVWPLPFVIPSWLFAIIFVVVSFFGMRSGIGNIGHDAHLGGAIVGLAAATVLYPTIVVRSPLLYGAVVLITAALVLYAYRRPNHLRGNPAQWRDLLNRRRAEAAVRRQADDEVFLDRTLATIAKSGLGVLSGRERRRLKAISKRKNRQDKQELQKPAAAGHLRWVENVESKD
jgi:membrane associated rhomboid family serine protease